ncbi:hypothetical protein [Hamadaea tsunoensis]|uniref:hypothetical protein n=1 Tax=Hamadaea tsunoensis TaxID=53368 RepID=UPI0012FA1492|nr:hypothetical protein [Hamadaea tsunoensis]
MKSTVILAPLALALYGVLRLVGKADGAYGPGWDWQAAHLAALAGVLLFIPAVLWLGRQLPRGAWRTSAVVVSLVGLVCAIVQFGADMVTAALSADHAEMSQRQGDFGDLPGVNLAVYAVGPQLFYIGLIVLTVLLAVHRRLPWWSVALLVVGVAVAPVSLNLLPVMGVLLAVALMPALRPLPTPAPTA